MRKKRTLLICAACALVAIIALLAYKSATAEPSYGGHPLSYWVVLPLISRNPELRSYDRKEATNAIDHIGVAALPFAMKWLRYEPQQWRTRVGIWLVGTKYFPFAGRLSNWILDPQPQQLGLGAYYVFLALGKRALPVFDDLCHLLNDTNRPKTSGEAARALGCLGTNALGPLLTAATNAQHPARLFAIDTISVMPELGDAAQLLIPAITNCLTPTNDLNVQMNALISLAHLKPQISVPVFVSSLNTPNPTIRRYSAITLGQLRPTASSVIPALTNALADPDPGVRECAARALHQIDINAFPNAPYP
jgi:hypothetical protein